MYYIIDDIIIIFFSSLNFQTIFSPPIFFSNIVYEFVNIHFFFFFFMELFLPNDATFFYGRTLSILCGVPFFVTLFDQKILVSFFWEEDKVKERAKKIQEALFWFFGPKDNNGL